MDNYGSQEKELIEQGKQAWQRQEWKKAIDCYTKALIINPESDARIYKEMAIQIQEYYHKDSYNP